MKTKIRRILSMLMVFCMMAGLMPAMATTAYADDSVINSVALTIPEEAGKYLGGTAINPGTGASYLSWGIHELYVDDKVKESRSVTLQAGDEVRVEMYVRIKEGYTFAEEGTATVNGKSATYNRFNSSEVRVTYSFTVGVTIPAKPSVTLNKDKLSLVVSGTEQLIATVTPDNATDKTVTWTSSKPEVATVDANGKVTAVAAGTATITATAGETSATCAVTVKPTEYTVTVENGSGDGNYVAGATVTITADAAEEGKAFDKWVIDGITVEDPTAETITFTMPKNEVSAVATYKDVVVAPTEYTVTVENGSGSGEYAAGEEVTITADAAEEGKVFVCWVVEGVEVEDPTAETITFTMPENEVSATATYEDAEGGDVEETPSVTLNKETLSLIVSGTEKLIATMVPEGLEGYELVWSSDKEGIATVMQDGTVTAVAVGTAKITVTLMPEEFEVLPTSVDEEGNPTASCVVTVTEKAPAPTPTPSKGGGGSTKYKVTLEDTDNGTVESNRTKASKGTTVTITVDPEAGYKVDDIVVETKAGKEVEVTDKGEGKFTFKMPAANVTVSVDFAKAEVEDSDTKEDVEYIQLTIDSVNAWVFDEYVTNDVAPVIRNARTMLPARFVAEALGGVVTWNEEAQKVTIVNGEDTIEIFIGEPFATVNGAPVELDSPAFIENSRTYLPIRFIAENMGATVTWDADARTVTIVPGE